MMKRLCEVGSGVALLASIFVVPAMASEDTVSVNGINSANLGLTGSGISVGLVEYERPGDPDINDNGMSFETGIDDDGSHSNFTTDPKAVFIENGLPPTPNSDEEIISDEGPPPAPYSHATEVAGVVISTDPVATGVAPEADLYASAGGQNTAVIPIMDKLALSAQHVALQDGGDVRGINFSFIIPFESGNSFDGHPSLLNLSIGLRRFTMFFMCKVATK